ncbi:hypothetical protein ACFPVY_07200 [Flavobacterium qiangtangense]|uniref:HlyD family secretion protein n=1 Tax=Flavobacterium qiangtangense TaxID=1442595 RepID=A0ABW1PLC4_9FLAO
MLIDKKNHLRSREMQQMLSQTPIWTIRLGTVVVLLVIMIFVSISWSVKYPNVVKEQIVITSNSSTQIPNEYVGVITLDAVNSDKIKIGQDVNMTLDNYPESEFGILYGTISHITSLPNKSDELKLEVSLKSGLKTSYGRQIVVGQKATGTAVITTHESRLIESLFYQFRGVYE